MKTRVLLCIVLFFCSKCEPSAITYELNGGRLGDNLSTYCKAKWFSYKYQIPLLYKPFEYSNQLTLHQLETPYNPDMLSQFDAVIKVKNEEDIKKNIHKNVLFVSNFYSQTPGLYELGFIDLDFARIIKEALSPFESTDSIEKSDTVITVALHVRKGGGFDAPLASGQIAKKGAQYADQQWPTKFPPDQYYVDQLRTIRKLIGNERRMIIYLFTDDPDPEKLARLYQENLSDSNVEFRYRTSGNSHDSNVVEDFYSMAQCDCLIRSSSLLAKAAQLLGNHQIIMHPIQGKWADDKVIINPVGIIIRE